MFAGKGTSFLTGSVPYTLRYTGLQCFVRLFIGPESHSSCSLNGLYIYLCYSVNNILISLFVTIAVLNFAAALHWISEGRFRDQFHPPKMYWSKDDYWIMHSFERPTPVTITITLNFVSFEFIIFFFSPSEWKKNSPYEVGYPVLYSILIALPLLPFLCFMIQTKESLERQVSLMVLTYRGSRKVSRFRPAFSILPASRNCDRSESYWKVLSCGAICHAAQNDNIFWICWWNSEVWIGWTTVVVLHFECVNEISRCETF